MSTVSSLRASRSGRTRRILAAAVSLAVPVAVISPARRPATRPSSAASASSSLGTAHATLAIGSARTVPLFAPGAARPTDNRTVIIEFLVDDVDGVHQNLAGFVEDFVQEPATMPWGNRSLLFRDPDGNLVNFFTPVTPAAIEKFGR